MSEQPHLPPAAGITNHSRLVAGTRAFNSEGPGGSETNLAQDSRAYMLLLTVKGTGVVHHAGHKFYCRPGDLVLIPPGVSHRYERAEQSHSWHLHWVCFRPQAWWYEWLHWSIPGAIARYRPEESLHPQIGKLIQEILAAGRGGERHGEALALNLLEQLLLRRMTWSGAEDAVRVDARVRAACQFITEHLTDSHFEIARVAQHVCLSSSRLSHLFRQTLGVSVLSWREEQRIAQAKLLLTTTRLPIASVGRHLGFDDQLYFSRVFKKCTGSSPSDFRAYSEAANEAREETAAAGCY